METFQNGISRWAARELLREVLQRSKKIREVDLRGRAMTPSLHGFRSLIENSPDAISLVDMQGQILYESASASKLFGYQPGELVGRNCLDLIHPEDREPSLRAFQDVLAKPLAPRQCDARIRHREGNYSWVESILSNLLHRFEVKAIVMRQRDISARKVMEAERKRHAEELTRSKLRLEEFAYTAAHDLREPLRAISLYTEILVRKTPMDSESEGMAKYIVDGAARMSALIEDMLSFASSGMPEEPRRVDLGHALAQALQSLEVMIKESHAVVRIDALPVVLGNEIQLVRLFQNLISNAVKYRGPRPVEIRVIAERGLDWLIKIADNGLGIAREDHQRIFMPFTRLHHKDVAGTGLGLAVCKRIVEQPGGRIWVESTLGAGSTFCFTTRAAPAGHLLAMIAHGKGASGPISPAQRDKR
jgi:PAS domain S-box-containing protein